MSAHEQAIREALEQFCRDYTGRETGWHVETWLHPVTRSVESATVMPEFAGMGITERIELISEYIRAHLPEEHQVHLSYRLGLTPEEYENTDWMPEEVQLVAAR